VSDAGGWLDAAARVSRRLLRSPRFRRDVEIVRDHVDADEAPPLVRTLIWTDPGLALSLVGAAPAAINAAVEAMAEVVTQVEGLPRPAVREFTVDTLERIRARTLGNAAGRALALALQLDADGPLWREALRGFCSAVADRDLLPLISRRADAIADELEQAVARDPDRVIEVCEELDRVLRAHPDLVRDAIRPLYLTFWEAIEVEEDPE